jgi:hypothetical protein
VDLAMARDLLDGITDPAVAALPPVLGPVGQRAPDAPQDR